MLAGRPVSGALSRIAFLIHIISLIQLLSSSLSVLLDLLAARLPPDSYIVCHDEQQNSWPGSLMKETSLLGQPIPCSVLLEEPQGEGRGV